MVRKPRGNYKPTKGGDRFSTFTIEVEPSKHRLASSTHVWVCPICKKRLYVDKSFKEQMDKAQSLIDSLGKSSIELAGPCCEDCYAVMEVHALQVQSEKGT